MGYCEKRLPHLLVLAIWLVLASAHRATAVHSLRVARHAVRTARALGLPRRERRALLYAGMLHDVGKLDEGAHAVVRKAGPLDPDERRQVERHVVSGCRLLSRFPALDPVTRLVAFHHEAFNAGSGYPTGLARENLPIGSRILSVCDCFDAMEEDRPYRNGIPVERITEYLRERAGTQFDPIVVRAFLQQLTRARSAQASHAVLNARSA